MKSLKVLSIALTVGMFVLASNATFAQSGKIAGDKEPVTIKMKQAQRAASQAKIVAKQAANKEAVKAKTEAKGVERRAVNAEARAALKAKIAKKRANAQLQKSEGRAESLAALKAERAAARSAAKAAFDLPERRERMRTKFQNRD